jgi:GTPase SAR1 family protein
MSWRYEYCIIDHINHFTLQNTVSPMDTKPHRQVPEIPFRVLIIGRANAGKTSILQRVCETTESPSVYRKTLIGNKLVRGSNHFVSKSDLTSDQINLEPSMEVSDNSTSLRLPLNMVLAGRTQYR